MSIFAMSKHPTWLKHKTVYSRFKAEQQYYVNNHNNEHTLFKN